MVAFEGGTTRCTHITTQPLPSPQAGSAPHLASMHSSHALTHNHTQCSILAIFNKIVGFCGCTAGLNEFEGEFSKGSILLLKPQTLSSS